MNSLRMTWRALRPLAAGVLVAVVAVPAGAVDLKNSDGTWTFSLNGNVNVDYIWSSCESAASAASIGGGLTCTGGGNGSSNVSNIGNGLLPAAFVFSVATTQNGIDLTGHLGLYPGIATNDGGSPNLQAGTSNGSSNTALGSTGLDIRQVYMTFGNKSMGTFTLGRNIGLFGADVILNDMTLPGVGAPGSAATAAPSNTTLGGIGFGYIYTDWLAQMDYTTPDFSGFNFTLGIFDPLNSLSEPANPATIPPTPATVQAKKAPGFHAKASYTLPFSEGNKLYVSIAYLTQQQDYISGFTGLPYSYTGSGVDVFGKLDIQALEVVAYYYHATGLGTTALFNLGAYSDALNTGVTRESNGYFGQVSYKFGALKVGVNYGQSNLDTANTADAVANPTLVASNRKGTLGLYYSLTKNLTLLAEGSEVKSKNQVGGSNSATTINAGAYFEF